MCIKLSHIAKGKWYLAAEEYQETTSCLELDAENTDPVFHCGSYFPICIEWALRHP